MKRYIFTLAIELGNDALPFDAESDDSLPDETKQALAAMLRETARQLERGINSRTLYDENGNRVGSCGVSVAF